MPAKPSGCSWRMPLAAWSGISSSSPANGGADGQESATMPARIAVINDDRPFLDLMEQLLQETEGYAVTTRKEWDGAYEFVKEHRPDLVILDIRIGGEERGWQILQMLTL